MVGAVALVAAACTSNGAVDTTSTVAPGSSSTTVATTTTSFEPTTTTVASTTTTVAATTTAELPPFPSDRDSLEHGGEAWAVYLAVSDDVSDPALTEATDLAGSYGFTSGVTDINCDLGAAEAVGVEPDGLETVAGLYFDSEAEAAQFVLAFEARGHEVVGMGLVQTFCLD